MSIMMSQITGNSALLNSLFRLTTKKTLKIKTSLLVLCEGNHSWLMDSPHKGSVMLKLYPCHDVMLNPGLIMKSLFFTWELRCTDSNEMPTPIEWDMKYLNLKRIWNVFFSKVPEVSPSGLRIDEDSLNATSAIFMWDDMDTGPGAMNGLFTGYEVSYSITMMV